MRHRGPSASVPSAAAPPCCSTCSLDLPIRFDPHLCADDCGLDPQWSDEAPHGAYMLAGKVPTSAFASPYHLRQPDSLLLTHRTTFATLVLLSYILPRHTRLAGQRTSLRRWPVTATASTFPERRERSRFSGPCTTQSTQSTLDTSEPDLDRITSL